MSSSLVRISFTLWLGILCSLGLRAEDGPYRSVGFLEFPADCRLEAVSAVAVDAADRIFVLQRGTPPVLAFSAEGKYERGWGEKLFKVPHGLRIDSAGNIWTTDNGNHVLRKFTPQGELLLTLGTEGKAGGGAEAFRSPDDLVFDSTGNLFVADAGNARIVKVSPEGKYLSQWGSKGKGPGQFATTHGLAIDPQNRIYVADRGNKRIQQFSPAGEHLADWNGFGNPFGLIMVGKELLASEGDLHRIFHLNERGQIVASWGSPEILKLPHLMALDARGRLYIAEVNGKRVQIFTR